MARNGGRSSQGDTAATISLFAAKTVTGLGSFITNLYLARAFGTDDYGRYAFAVATLTFTSLFFDFGYFSSGARLLTSANSEGARRGYAGGMLIIGVTVSALFAVTVYLLAFVIDPLFGENIGVILRSVAIAAPLMIAPFVVEQSLKALQRIYLLAVWNALTKLSFLAGIAWFVFQGTLNARLATFAYLVANLPATIWVFVAVQPSLTGARGYLRSVAEEQRRFGQPLYVGKLANLASYSSDRLLLALFHDARVVGWYSLAMSMASFVAVFSRSQATSAFRDFGALRAISARLLHRNHVSVLLAVTAVIAAGPFVVRLYLGDAYAPVAYLLVPCALAMAFQAAYQPYNSWLLANGFGAPVKRLLFVVAGANLVLNFLLIPFTGPTGAAVASAGGMATYLFLARRCYRQSRAALRLEG